MLDVLHRTYIRIFHRYPMLGRMALLVMLGEIVQSSVNNYSLPFFVLDDLHRPGTVLGVLISTFLIAEMLLKLPFGHLSDHHGRRPFVVAGIACSGATALAICLAPKGFFLAFPVLVFAILLPLRAVDGAAAASLWPPLFSGVPDNVPSEERGVAMSVMNTGYLAGIALGPALGGAVLAVWRAQHVLPPWDDKGPFLMAVVAAFLGTLLARGMPNTRVHEGEFAEISPGEWPKLNVIAIIVIITLGETFATATLAPYMAPYVQQVTGFPRQSIGVLMLAFFAPAGILGIPLGHLSDRFPKRRVVQLSLLISTAGLWGMASSRSLPHLLISAAVVALGFMFGLPSWLALITDLAPQGRVGRIMGLMSTAQGAGAFLGPLVGGFLWDINIHYPFFAAGILLSLSALVALIFLGRTLPAPAGAD